MQQVLFEVGRANVGDARKRATTSELLRDWNAALQGVRVTGAIGHTGNYIAESDLAIEEVAAMFRRMNISIAAFSAADFLAWAVTAQEFLSHIPQAPSGRRPTGGVVMNLDPAGGTPLLPPSSERVIFATFIAPRVRGVWKLDVLTADGRKLDRTNREGGWGSISALMKRHAGGEWTARSMQTVNRLAARLQTLA